MNESHNNNLTIIFRYLIPTTINSLIIISMGTLIILTRFFYNYILKDNFAFYRLAEL